MVEPSRSDHVPHGEGDRPLGSQRKSTAPDVELIFKQAVKFKPGHGGRAKITGGRDRDAAITPCEFVLEPDYSWRLEAIATAASLSMLQGDDDRVALKRPFHLPKLAAGAACPVRARS